MEHPAWLSQPVVLSHLRLGKSDPLYHDSLATGSTVLHTPEANTYKIISWWVLSGEDHVFHPGVPLPSSHPQWPPSGGSLKSLRGGCCRCQRNNRLLILQTLCILRKQKDRLWNPALLWNARVPRKTRLPDSWFSRGLLSTNRNTSACCKGKAIQLALTEVSSFPTGVNWVPCMLFWTWLNIKRYLFPDGLWLQGRRRRHIQALKSLPRVPESSTWGNHTQGGFHWESYRAIHSSCAHREE